MSPLIFNNLREVFKEILFKVKNIYLNSFYFNCFFFKLNYCVFLKYTDNESFLFKCLHFFSGKSIVKINETYLIHTTLLPLIAQFLTSLFQALVRFVCIQFGKKSCHSFDQALPGVLHQTEESWISMTSSKAVIP